MNTSRNLTVGEAWGVRFFGTLWLGLMIGIALDGNHIFEMSLPILVLICWGAVLVLELIAGTHWGLITGRIGFPEDDLDQKVFFLEGWGAIIVGVIGALVTMFWWKDLGIPDFLFPPAVIILFFMVLVGVLLLLLISLYASFGEMNKEEI